VSRPRQAFCKRGHSLRDSRRSKTGAQVCRKCHALRAALWRRGRSIISEKFSEEGRR
jgi:hypothetical protein